jgi:hypothetical protein
MKMETQRMNNEEYEQALTDLENTQELTLDVLKLVTAAADECNARGLESMMGKRSRRGKSGPQSRRYVKMMNDLQDRFQCKLSRRHTDDYYTIRMR